MEALILFIAKSGGLLILFYLAYYFLLRKETFFTSNRWFLLAGLITSVVLPFIVYTQIVWVDPTPAPVSDYNYDTTYFPQQTIQEESFEINWNYVSLGIYALGLAAFLIKIGIDFYSLNSVLKGKEVQQQADFKLIDINENIAPFSYFDYIVYNSSMFSEAELENILEHEKVHSDQDHTVDVLISRVFCALFWFNPVMWLYKKAILQNLEFIADSEATKKISDKKAYQYTLLKITTHESCVAITNHFYQSLIKKRIVMLNKNQSKKTNYWKYYAVIPALVAFVLIFQIETIAQEKKAIEKEIAEKEQSVDVYKIKKTTTDQELKEMGEKLKQNHNVDVAVSNVKRNNKSELTAISVEVKRGNEQIQNIDIDGDGEAIKDFGIVVATNDDGSKDINVVTSDDEMNGVSVSNKQRIILSDNSVAPVAPIAGMTPPTPPAPPVFPAGALPPAPAIDMSKMPKPPVAPINMKDKVAVTKFEKEMAEFEKKMEAFEPNLEAMEAYGEEIEKIMSQREAIFEKEMEKYEIAMEQFNANMEKFGQYSEKNYGPDSKQFEMDMRELEKNMRQHELDMKQHEKDMKQHEKDMKLNERELKRMEREKRRS
ncbi:peptidase M56 [Flavobacterium sp. GA093]|uniref:Peptidase M56 n=1 Tax=Flavobacterium hydrocarbonoxydans TaxID=2683249 RepID=A0A6I4NZH8_9FLAO|nr:M56 family metallopeptidase [Flavobacterium hydrocarbonoxydans]MWB96344.1 peptidase M56 [Flavobacterium hydrocarbonoxydans]